MTIQPFRRRSSKVTGWSLPSVTVPQIKFPVIQLPDISVPGGGATLIKLHTGNILFPDYDINLQSFTIGGIQIGFGTQGYIGAFTFPSISIGAMTLPMLTISNPSGGPLYSHR